MEKPKLEAKEVLDDIKAGMDAVALMQKYSLSPRGLQSLFAKLAAEGLVDEDMSVVEDWRPPGMARAIPETKEKKEVSARDVWADMKEGLSDGDLMEKYRLSQRGLQSLFNKIIDAGFIKEYELENGKPSLKRKAKKLLDTGGDVNLTLYYGCTLLNAAAGTGNAALVRILLTRGADPNARSKNGETALMKACRNGNTEAAGLLLDRGADADASDSDGLTALMFAAATGHAELVKLLIQEGADADAAERNGVTALMMASSGGCTDVVNVLLSEGADVNLCEKQGVTPLMMAAHEGFKEIVELMLERNPDVQAKDQSGKTASMWAHKAGHRDISLLLTKYARQREQ